MIELRYALTLVVMLILSSVTFADEPELTMEIIESLDQASEHNRIRLPGQKIANAPDGSNIKQRQQLEALLASQRKDSIQTSVAKNGEQGQNSTQAVGRENTELREAIVSYRREMADRGQEIADELRQEQAERTSSVIAGNPDDPVAKK